MPVKQEPLTYRCKNIDSWYGSLDLPGMNLSPSPCPTLAPNWCGRWTSKHLHFQKNLWIYTAVSKKHLGKPQRTWPSSDDPVQSSGWVSARLNAKFGFRCQFELLWTGRYFALNLPHLILTDLVPELYVSVSLLIETVTACLDDVKIYIILRLLIDILVTLIFVIFVTLQCLCNSYGTIIKALRRALHRHNPSSSKYSRHSPTEPVHHTLILSQCSSRAIFL